MAGKGGRIEGAGRKKGSPNKAKRELQALISDAIVNKCLDNLTKLANGNLKVEKTNKKGDTEIFYTEPNYFANAYLLDQKFGKARQKTDISMDGGIQITINDFTDK